MKCLTTDGYGPKIANKLIVALDSFFELYVEEELTNEIMIQVPEGSVYGFASPYASGRKFCAHGEFLLSFVFNFPVPWDLTFRLSYFYSRCLLQLCRRKSRQSNP